MAVAKKAFAKAPKLKTEDARAPRKPPTPVVLLAGLFDVTITSLLSKVVTEIHKSRLKALNTNLTEYFVREGMRLKRQPPNVTLRDKSATASGQCKMRKNDSVLNDDELLVCREHNVPLEDFAVGLSALVFNPKYADDQETLKKVEDALKQIDGLPRDFIVSVSLQRKIVTSKTLDYIFSLDDKSKVEALLAICANITPSGFSLVEDEPVKHLDRLMGLVRDKDKADKEEANGTTA